MEIGEELRRTIEKFVGEVNNNERVQKLIRKWSSVVNIWGRDIDEGYILEVQNGKVISVRKAASKDDATVKVIGDTATLIRMFNGKEKIAHLYLDGVIETYGSERDQIVLDAIARLLWS
jgi:predicted lipid carrier protein YhbT